MEIATRTNTLWDVPVETAPPQLAGAVEDFLTNQASPSTAKVYRREIVAFLDTLRKPVLEATSQDLIEFRRGLRVGLKPATVSRKLSTLRSFFRFLAEGGYRETNPAQVLKLPKIANTSPYRVLTAEELRALIATADLHTSVGVRDYAILMLLSVNALRESELAGLDQEDLNIAESYSVAVIRGKGSKVRVCKIAGTVAEALAAWQALRKSTTGPIFVAVNGKRITNRRLGTRSIRYRVKHYALAAGITRKVSPHALRHAAITHSLANGANILKVRDMAGHASLTTTQRYLHILDGLADNAADYNPLAHRKSS